jgi:hypothetical protein
MNIRAARKRAKAIYGKQAFVKISNGAKDILLDNIPVPGITGILLGWGSTWEEAFASARKRVKRYEKKNSKPRQVQSRSKQPRPVRRK